MTLHPEHRRRASALGLFLLALVIRLAWMPTWSRLQFDGHERLYLRAFQGNPPDPSMAAYPLLCGLYQVIGQLTDDPRALLVLSALVGSIAVVGVFAATLERFGERAALWAGIFVAVLGEHAAWSTSAYNVILPHALLVWAFALRPRWAMLLIALATSLRAEVAVIGLLRGWPGLAGVLVGSAWLLYLDPVPAGDLGLVLQSNLPMLRFLGPPVLLLALLGVPRAPSLILGVLAIHLSGSLFSDYGTRHALMGGVLLCVLVAIAAARRHGWLLGVALVLGLLFDTHQIARSWYARPSPPAAALDLPPLSPDCTEVSEEPPIEGQPIPSHFGLLSGEISADCVVWGEESQHHQWSSRGLRERAWRMRTLYTLEPIAAWRPGDPTRERIYHRLHTRWRHP